MEVVEDGAEWTLEQLYYGGRSEDEVPDVDDVRRLLNEYHRAWSLEGVTPQTVGPRVFRMLNIDEHATGITWNHIRGQFTKDFVRWMKLHRWTTLHGINDEGEVRDKLKDVQQIYKLARQYIVSNNTMFVRVRNGSVDVLPEEEQENAGMGGHTLADLDDAKLTSWQETFLKLRVMLAAENFRRAGKYFLRRSITASNLETQAFEPAIEIAHFIDDNTRYDDNLDVWIAHTSSFGNHEQMIKYMTERPIAEAPDIEENCHLRSYEGDAFGRGAVIYDSATDMAWPYAMRSHWPHMEKRVNDIRRQIYRSEFRDERHRVTAPTAEDVCVIHLKSFFPYDIFAETEELMQNNDKCLLQCMWYEAEHFECYDPKYRVSDYKLEAHMQRVLTESPSDDHDAAWGHSWQLAAGAFHPIGTKWTNVGAQKPTTGTEVVCDALSHLLETKSELTLVELDTVRAQCTDPIEADSFVRVSTTLEDGTTATEYCKQEGTLREVRVRTPDVVEQLTKLERFPLTDEFLRENVLDDITEFHYVANASKQVWVPLHTPPRKRRYRVSRETWLARGGVEERLHRRSFMVLQPFAGQRWTQIATPPEGFEQLSVASTVSDLLHANLYEGESCLPKHVATTLALTETCYVRAHDAILVPIPIDDTRTRYLRVHTGRTWRDCFTPQFDKIYDSQSFCTHDKFMLWGQKGRTLFKVHEFDTHQVTFIIIGYGGTGKSTIMVVMQKFWPAHLRGILSSNIEQKFGMSQVIQKGKTRAIFCNEVSQDLQLVQEEWQTSCSGEEGSYAVKHEAPWVGICLAHHFWVGNAWPKHWKNNNNQVSRRLCGVLMDTPIQPRDGNVMQEIERIMAVVQRKMVLAYFDMLDQYGSIDPMSRPDMLPPSFKKFYDDGRGISNPVERFLEECNGVQFLITSEVGPPWNVPMMMETATFRDMYMAWRSSRSDLTRIPSVSPDQYLPPLRERGVVEHHWPIRYPDGVEKTTSVLIGIGLLNQPPPIRITTPEHGAA